ncbi:MAG: V-type ATP synthase subunit E [Pyrobaculum sp.]
MSLFEDLIKLKIRELEELKGNLLTEIETRIRKETDLVLNKFLDQISKVESEVFLEKERIIYDAVIQSRKEIAEIYEQILDDFINSLFDEIDKLRGSERYIKFLTSLLEKSTDYIQSKDLIIYTSPRDRGVVETLARSMGITGLVSERDIKGGVVASSKDGSVVVDFSIETLVANLREELKHLLYKATL